MLKAEDFKTGLGHSHAVSFKLWKRDNKRKTSIPNTKELNKYDNHSYNNEICYRNLVKGAENEDVNSVLSTFTYGEVGKKKALQWLKLAKKNRFLPSYINVKKSVDKEQLVFSLTKHTKNEWYIFLSITRFLHSEPCTVLNTLMLVNKGVDFFTALIIASKVEFDNSNHHFIPNSWCHQYLDNAEKLLSRKINIKEVTTLKTFIKTMHTMEIKHDHFTGFTCNKHMEDIYKDMQTTEGFSIKKISSKKYKAKLAKLI